MVNIFRYVGIGHETTFGVEAAATIYLDPSSCTLDSPAGYEILIEGGMGRSVTRKRPGFYSTGGSIEYPVDINSVGYMMRGAFDQYTFTSGSPGNTHEFYGGNTNELDSWTYRVGKDVHEHIFMGCSVNSLRLNVDSGLATASVDLYGAQDDTTTLKTYSAIQSLIPTEYPLAFYDVTATINSVDTSAKCKTVSWTCSNNLGKDSGRSIGSMYPATFKAGNRVIETQLSLQFDDLTHQTLFWGDDGGPSCSGSTLFPLTLTFDGGDSGEMEISMPNCVMTSIPTQPRGRDALYQTITCRALLKEDVALADASTVDTDCLVTLVNAGATLA